jgi:adenylate kinase
MYGTDSNLPNVIITGTPGVGKTSLSILLADKLNEKFNTDKFVHLNLGNIINENKLYTEWNKEFDVPEFDEDKVLDYLEPLIKEGGKIIDFHSADFINDELIPLIVLLRCNNTALYDRLALRNYTERKIKENIECEIMEVTADDVKQYFPNEKILEIPNEEVEQMEYNINLICDRLTN